MAQEEYVPTGEKDKFKKSPKPGEVQIDPETGKAKPKEVVDLDKPKGEVAETASKVDADAPKVEKPKPTKAVDPDADDPSLGLAERAARGKRRKAKAAGQTDALK